MPHRFARQAGTARDRRAKMPPSPDGSAMATPPPAAPPRRADAARERHARWEPTIRAFACVDDAAWEGLDGRAGPLAGLALGVKDIVDAVGLPTRRGSRAFADAPPAAADAPLVAALRRAGAAVIGKTASTEFAFTDPTETRNPHAPAHTPGGSSSGSGAAVGAGVLDLAIATQTAGSLCRPAAYCGAVGFKPTYGRLALDGVAPLAPSFDTIGFIARCVEVAALALHAAEGGDGPSTAPHAGGATAGTVRSPSARRDEPDAPRGRQPTAGAADVHPGRGHASDRDPPMRIGIAGHAPGAPVVASVLAARSEAAGRLALDGARIDDATAPVDLARVVADHRIVMLHEAARCHGHLLGTAGGLLQPNFAAALREGAGVDAGDAAAARLRLADARAAFWEAMGRFDALLALAVPDVAPPLDGTTGYQHLLTPWTVFGGPLLCLPWGADAQGLPLSVMLAGPPGSDLALLALGARLERMAPTLRPPAAPPRG
jgi:Asp-tRNA(Asn)/Glu-tRNA(Gln) amidotransferase A subunit family amidase